MGGLQLRSELHYPESPPRVNSNSSDVAISVRAAEARCGCTDYAAGGETSALNVSVGVSRCASCIFRATV